MAQGGHARPKACQSPLDGLADADVQDKPAAKARADGAPAQARDGNSDRRQSGAPAGDGRR